VRYLLMVDGSRLAQSAVIQIEAAEPCAGTPGGVHAVHFMRGDEVRVAECTAYELARFMDDE